MGAIGGASTANLAQITSQDQFLVLACDGVFDVLTSEEVVANVYNNMKIHADAQRCVTHPLPSRGVFSGLAELCLLIGRSVISCACCDHPRVCVVHLPPFVLSLLLFRLVWWLLCARDREILCVSRALCACVGVCVCVSACFLIGMYRASQLANGTTSVEADEKT